jgi:hypothetical protein
VKSVTLKSTDLLVIMAVVAEYGLRPVVDAVAAAAQMLLEAGEPVKDEQGESMDREDIETAVRNLLEGLY